MANGIIEQIVNFYGFEGSIEESRSFGNGHINDTVLLVMKNGSERKKYILQKLNTYIFKYPEQLMTNTILVTEHLKKKIIARGGDPERETVNVVLNPDGKSMYVDTESGCWRVTKFIDNATSYNIIESPEIFYEGGKAFGGFQRDLSDFPAEKLYEVIPGFHDTRARYRNFIKSVEADVMNRASAVRDDIDFILEREKVAVYSMESYERGELPLRVTHNDTKFNNIMIDNATKKPVCILDLDTVMPGFAMTDYGDAIRTGACTGTEDEQDLSKVHCDLTLYDAYTRGFIEGCGGNLTKHEIESLPMGAMIATYEQGLRFLVDYIEGDVYFKDIKYPENNLVRARTQIKMVQEMESKWDEIQNLIGRYA